MQSCSHSSLQKTVCFQFITYIEQVVSLCLSSVSAYLQLWSSMFCWQQVESIQTSSRLSRQLDVSKKKTRFLLRMSVLVWNSAKRIVALFQQSRDAAEVLSESFSFSPGCFMSEFAEYWQCRQAVSCLSWILSNKNHHEEKRQLHNVAVPFPLQKGKKTLTCFLTWHSHIGNYWSQIRIVLWSPLGVSWQYEWKSSKLQL